MTAMATVLTGIDVLESQDFELLKGKRIGVLTNQTGVDSSGRRTIDVLAHAPGVQLTAIFSPEHGVTGELDTTARRQFARCRDWNSGL